MQTVLDQPDFGPATVYGNGASITYSFDVTYKFVWVPSEDDQEDDGMPVTEVRQLGFTGMLGWNGNSGFQDWSAGCSGSWSLQVTSPGGTSSAGWSAGMTSTPNYPDPNTVSETGTWGPVGGNLSYTLSGTQPEVRLNFQGSITSSGPAEGSLELNAPAPGSPGSEGIWHTFPVKNTTYFLTTNLTQTGVWRGNPGNTYRIRFSWTNLDSAGNVTTNNFNPTGDLSGTGRVLSWTGGTFNAVNLRRHWSYAYLDQKVNGVYPNPPSPVKTSAIPFQSKF